ncbi:hypothetical protein [Mycolicibacterium hodleri]|uniref:hypothetical protein n=1 Tax=Mycolicibacterium hodleri TaxID=49897 RepID=UPI00195F4533|nr:hypothetical protein [Mycolicibacterium hodleri]
MTSNHAALDEVIDVLPRKPRTSVRISRVCSHMLVRTNAEVSRHRGISMLLVPLVQPGVEVPPITMATGSDALNEAFFIGARTKAENVVLGVDQGKETAMALLGLERGDEAATNPIPFRAEVD